MMSALHGCVCAARWPSSPWRLLFSQIRSWKVTDHFFKRRRAAHTLHFVRDPDTRRTPFLSKNMCAGWSFVCACASHICSCSACFECQQNVSRYDDLQDKLADMMVVIILRPEIILDLHENSHAERIAAI